MPLSSHFRDVRNSTLSIVALLFFSIGSACNGNTNTWLNANASANVKSNNQGSSTELIEINSQSEIYPNGSELFGCSERAKAERPDIFDHRFASADYSASMKCRDSVIRFEGRGSVTGWLSGMWAADSRASSAIQGGFNVSVPSYIHISFDWDGQDLHPNMKAWLSVNRSNGSIFYTSPQSTQQSIFEIEPGNYNFQAADTLYVTRADGGDTKLNWKSKYSFAITVQPRSSATPLAYVRAYADTALGGSMEVWGSGFYPIGSKAPIFAVSRDPKIGFHYWNSNGKLDSNRAASTLVEVSGPTTCRAVFRRVDLSQPYMPNAADPDAGPVSLDGDEDGDGTTNGEEMINGTDMYNRNSTLWMSPPNSTGTAQLSTITPLGEYTLERLNNGTWDAVKPLSSDRSVENFPITISMDQPNGIYRVSFTPFWDIPTVGS